MDNHLHLALQVAETPLAKGMQNLAFPYARWINRRENRTGRLFQDCYQAILVERDRYLLALTRYIHLNPIRAGLVRQPEHYPWSGHRAYLDSDGLPWLTADWVLGQFGRETQTAQRRYRRFVHDGIGLGHEPRFHASSDTDGRVLGADTLTAINWRFNQDVATPSAGVKRLRMKVQGSGSGDEPWQPVLHRFNTEV